VIRRRLLALAPALAGLALGAAAGTAAPAPPSPYEILDRRWLATPLLEAVSLCLPSDLPASLGAVAARARAGESPSALALRLREPGPAAGPDPERGHLAALLAARGARERAERLAALAGLRALAEEPEPGARGVPDGFRLCAHLESARLLLALERFPEAAAQASRAGRLASERAATAPLAESAELYRAEGLFRAGWLREADLAYRRLAYSTQWPLAAAARLRVADAVFERGDRARVAEDYETLLARAGDFGASERGWALRASEAALAAGRREPARRFAERLLALEPTHPARPAVEIRLADLALLDEREAEARERLERLAQAEGESPAGWLARARLAALPGEPAAAAQRLEALATLARVPHRNVSLYAQALLVHELVGRGDWDEALALHARLSYEAVPDWLAPQRRRDLARTLAAVAALADGEAGCLGLVRRLGGRYALLAGSTLDPAPFLRLGGCYESRGLALLAHKVYRSLAVGEAAAREVALPLARTALASGDLAYVRRAAAGTVRRAGEEAGHWLLILAEGELADGSRTRARQLLRALVERGEPAGQRLAALRAFALSLAAPAAASGERGAPAGDADDPDRELLRRGLEGLGPEERAADPRTFGEAALLAAEGERRAGRAHSARALYASAAAALPPGATHSHAAYFAAALAPALDAAALTWRTEAEQAPPGGWQRLARAEAGIAPVRDRLGAWPPRAGEGAP